MELGLGSVLDVLVLKNDAECSSQCVKRTSGARVLITEFSSISACRSEVRWGAGGAGGGGGGPTRPPTNPSMTN